MRGEKRTGKRDMREQGRGGESGKREMIEERAGRGLKREEGWERREEGRWRGEKREE